MEPNVMKLNITIAIAIIAALTGCSAKPQAPAQPTPAMLAQSITETQKQIQTIKDNPSIPDGTKQAIVSRLQNNIDRTKASMPAGTPSATTP